MWSAEFTKNQELMKALKQSVENQGKGRGKMLISNKVVVLHCRDCGWGMETDSLSLLEDIEKHIEEKNPEGEQPHYDHVIEATEVEVFEESQ